MDRDRMSAAEKRRLKLIRWMRVDERDGLTASQISMIAIGLDLHDLELIYSSANGVNNGRSERCYDDLKVLESRGLVSHDGRPARWSVIA